MTDRKVCLECGKTFKRNTESRESRPTFSRRLFCSNSCSQKNRVRLLREIADSVPELNEYFKIKGDCIVVADWHIPAFNPEVTEIVFEKAEELGINQILIAGDFLQLDAFSPHTTYPIKNVEKIYWIWYNHSEWLVNYLENKIDINILARMFYDKMEGKQLLVQRYGFAVINDTFRVTHPKSYSRCTPQVERQLAAKFHQHIIGTHGHQNSIGFDSSGQYICLQVGGLHHRTKISYTMRDTTHPEWNNGFAWVKDNKLGYYFQHKDLEN
jgi:hypothetical protein